MFRGHGMGWSRQVLCLLPWARLVSGWWPCALHFCCWARSNLRADGTGRGSGLVDQPVPRRSWRPPRFRGGLSRPSPAWWFDLFPGLSVHVHWRARVQRLLPHYALFIQLDLDCLSRSRSRSPRTGWTLTGVRNRRPTVGTLFNSKRQTRKESNRGSNSRQRHAKTSMAWAEQSH